MFRNCPRHRRLAKRRAARRPRSSGSGREYRRVRICLASVPILLVLRRRRPSFSISSGASRANRCTLRSRVFFPRKPRRPTTVHARDDYKDEKDSELLTAAAGIGRSGTAPSSARGTPARISGRRTCLRTALSKDCVWIRVIYPRGSRSSALARSQGGQ